MNDDVKKELDQLGEIIDGKIEKATGQAMERADKKADETLKTEIGNLVNKFNERMDAMEMAQKKNQNSIEAKQGFKAGLTKALNEGALESFKQGNTNAASFAIKADMTIGADFSGDVIPPERVAGYKYDPSRQFHVRSILPQGSTSSDVVRYIKESGYSDGSATKNEGATLGQSDFDMQAVSTPIEKIGAYFRISEEMMDSTPQLSSYLSARAPEKLLAVEDTQLIDGNGSAPNLTGIYTNATAFSAGGFANAVESANEFDCITVALNQLGLANYNADYILMNPTDFHKILLLKSSQNEYLVKNWQEGLVPRIAGVPVIATTAITSDKYLLGNFAQGAQFWVKDNVSLGFFREDGTNVRDGFVTVRIQERVACTPYLPNAFVAGDFSSDKAALETP
jgi:HK97 family phage major capsid protein